MFEHINNIKEARTKKGLSQRALSEKVGMPQSHVSKIESGKVDIKLSGLIEIARALALEFMLVPWNPVPAIEALSGANFKETEKHANAEPSLLGQASTTIREAHRALAKIAKDATRLSRVLGAAARVSDRNAYAFPDDRTLFAFAKDTIEESRHAANGRVFFSRPLIGLLRVLTVLFEV